MAQKAATLLFLICLLLGVVCSAAYLFKRHSAKVEASAAQLPLREQAARMYASTVAIIDQEL